MSAASMSLYTVGTYLIILHLKNRRETIPSIKGWQENATRRPNRLKMLTNLIAAHFHNNYWT